MGLQFVEVTFYNNKENKGQLSVSWFTDNWLLFSTAIILLFSPFLPLFSLSSNYWVKKLGSIMIFAYFCKKIYF